MAVPLRDEERTRRFPWITLGLIVVNVIVFLFLQPSAFQTGSSSERSYLHELEREREGTEFALRYGAVACELWSGASLAEAPRECDALSPAELGPARPPLAKSVYLALLTCMFLHGSIAHLAGNMLFLWVFGNNVEDSLGRLRYLLLYLLGGIVGTLAFAAANLRSGVPLIGASGAIAAAMGAYLALHPRGRILTAVATAAFQVVYVPAAVVLALFFVTQFFTPDAQVAWEAHVGGMVAGFLAAHVLAQTPWVKRRADADRADLAVRAGSAF